MELLFNGAAGEVTGSNHWLRVDGRWVLLDCGMFQGRRADTLAKNQQWPAPPGEVAAVVLSHAHIDHSGRLPLLVKDGFRGPIYCTPATRDLAAVMLADSAHIQVEDAVYINRKREKEGQPPISPLYEPADATAAIKRMISVPYGSPFDVVPGVRAEFHDAGHMLGSAFMLLHIQEAGRTQRLLFTGDLGRRNTPILRDPEAFPAAEVVISESTYGSTVNESPPDAHGKFIEAVQRCYARGGKVIIPAFSVGRTQTVVYYLQLAIDEQKIPCHTVYVDSPLAVDATQVYMMHADAFDQEASEFQRRTGNLLGSKCCVYIRDVEDSKALNHRKGPYSIISASGMCEAGRIQHHLRNNIESPANLILFAGYQAEGTLGRRIVDGVKSVNLFHTMYTVRAEIEQIHGFSGHADQADLLRMLTPLASTTEQIFLVHGEEQPRNALAGKLTAAGFRKVARPIRGERVAV